MPSFLALSRTLFLLDPGHQSFNLVTECPRALTRGFECNACLDFFSCDRVHLGASIVTFRLIDSRSGRLLIGLELRNARLVVGRSRGESRFGFCKRFSQTSNFLLRCIQGGSDPGHLLAKLCS